MLLTTTALQNFKVWEVLAETGKLTEKRAAPLLLFMPPSDWSKQDRTPRPSRPFRLSPVTALDKPRPLSVYCRSCRELRDNRIDEVIHRPDEIVTAVVKLSQTEQPSHAVPYRCRTVMYIPQARCERPGHAAFVRSDSRPVCPI